MILSYCTLLPPGLLLFMFYVGILFNIYTVTIIIYSDNENLLSTAKVGSSLTLMPQINNF